MWKGRQTEVTQGGWGEEEPSLQTGQPSSGPMDLSRVRVGCVGRTGPKAYPVLGEEPCRDTAYVLGMARPTWCSRCGPPEQEGRQRGQRKQENEKEQVKQGARLTEEEREEGKKVGKDGQIDRQPRDAGSPAPCTYPPSIPALACGSWALICRDGPLNHTLLQPQGPALLPFQRGSPVPGPPTSSLEYVHGEEPKKGALQGMSGHM